MTDLTPPITDAERAEADRRFALYGLDEDDFGGFTWRALIATLVQAMREPAWVPEVEGCMSGWSDAEIGPSTGGTGILHPDWVLELADDIILDNPLHSHRGHIATALMTPPPKPPVDDATACYEALRSGNPVIPWNDGAVKLAIIHALNWAKNREKRDA